MSCHFLHDGLTLSPNGLEQGLSPDPLYRQNARLSAPCPGSQGAAGSLSRQTWDLAPWGPGLPVGPSPACVGWGPGWQAVLLMDTPGESDPLASGGQDSLQGRRRICVGPGAQHCGAVCGCDILLWPLLWGHSGEMCREAWSRTTF